jgi:hypothetical protein
MVSCRGDGGPAELFRKRNTAQAQCLRYPLRRHRSQGHPKTCTIWDGLHGNVSERGDQRLQPGFCSA